MNRTLLIFVVAAAAAGFGLAALVLEHPPTPTATDPELESLRARIAELEAGAATPPAPTLKAATPPETGESEGTAPPRKPLSGSAQDAASALADAIRARAKQMHDTADIAARARIEQDAARERASREDLKRGGTMTWLKKLERDFTPPFEMLGSAEVYGRLFERKAKGSRVEGASLDLQATLEDGDTLLFGPGLHMVNTNVVFNLRNPFPKDLVVEGYGMDETVLVLSTDISIRSALHSLTFKDLTIHCNNNYMDRSRSAPFTLRLERCRVVGFDMAAGGSCMLGGSVGALYATGCRFEAGFGRSPGSGNLFDVRGLALSRMEDCDIVGPFRSVFRRGSRAAYVFENCRFTRTNPGLKAKRERYGEIARFPGCTFEYLTAEDARKRGKTRPLTEINATWKIDPPK